jgi:DNA-binding MarR family transcriptional regulator
MTAPTDHDYERLLELRTGLRRFLHWSETQAQAAGITPAQHQLLLAIRGHRDPRGPTIGEIADYLVLRHHSAVGLTDRAAAAGLAVREPDTERPGTVRLSLTDLGSKRLDALAELHIEELTGLAPTMQALWRTLGTTPASNDPGPAARPCAVELLPSR